MSIEKVLYRAKATSQGGREGTSRSDNGVLDVKLTTPKELGGNGATGTRSSCSRPATRPASWAR